MKISNLIGNALLGTCLYGAVTNSFLTNEEKDTLGEIGATNAVEQAACAAALGLKTTLGLTQGEIVAAIRGVDGECADGRVEVKNVESGREGLESAAGETRRGTVLGRSQWGIRGAWDDDCYQAFETDCVFPFGTNHLSGVVVYSQGGLAASSYDAPFVALPVPVAIVPCEGAFTVEQTSASTVFAWWNVRPGRTATETLDAQIELFRNGDYCVSTNGVFVGRYIRGNPYPDVPMGQYDDYRDWVDDQVGVGLENGFYKFTASFPVDPPEATLLAVGEESIVVTNAGEYVFVLEKGREYEFETIPYDPTVEYWMQDDLADCPVFANWWWEDDVATWTEDGGMPEIRRQTRDEKGRCLWMPLFRGSPDVSHIGPEDALEFVALFEDYCHEDGVSYNWYCEDSNVIIESPHSRVTTVRFDEMPNWRSASLSVEATIGAYVLRSALASFSYGTNSVPEPASVSVSFDKKAILFEPEHEVDGVVLAPRRSTTSILHCSAKGGDTGGVALFTINASEKLIRVSGREFPVAVHIAPGEDVAFDVVYEGLVQSERLDDIVAEGSMVPNGFSQQVANDSLTVVSLTTDAKCEWIADSRRKTLGVRESVEMILDPAEVELTVEFSNCERYDEMWYYRAPKRACTETITTLFRGAELSTEFTVQEPVSIAARDCVASMLGDASQAGAFVAQFSLNVFPTNVSFGCVEVMEVPTTSSDAEGYFAEERFCSLMNHGDHGAGTWHSLGRQNSFKDTAGFRTALPMPWSGGGFSWRIPNAWRTKEDEATTNEFSHSSLYDQHFSMTAAGRASVSKFGFSVSRAVNEDCVVERSGQ